MSGGHVELLHVSLLILLPLLRARSSTCPRWERPRERQQGRGVSPLLLRWLGRRGRGPDLDLIDPDESTEIPVNPCPEKVLNAFAVRVESTPTFLNQAGLERPSIVVETPEDCFLVWFHNPLDPSVMTEKDGVKKPSRYNLWLKIRHLYAFHLGGMEVDVMGNPLRCRAEWLTTTPHHLDAMKAKLIKAGQWNSSRPPQFFTKGGALQTPAQVRARKEAFAAALEQRQAKSLDRARRRLKAAEACSHEQLAEAMGCSIDSVPRILRRAESQ